MTFELSTITTGGPVRLALYGESFTGKSHSVVSIARALVGPDGLIAIIDTEGKASAFAGQPNIQSGRLTDYSPQALLQAIRAVEASDAVAIIIDSLSDVWDKPGGLISIAKSDKKSSQRGWGVASALEKEFHAAIQSSPLHIFATLRARTDSDGKNLKYIQRDDVRFIFDTMGWMDARHTLHIDKAYAPGLLNATFPRPGENVATILRQYYLTSTAPRWVHDDEFKTKFFQFAADNYDFSSADALAALNRQQVFIWGGVEVVTIEDYTGSRNEAKQALQDYNEYLATEAENAAYAQPTLDGMPEEKEVDYGR